MEQLLNNSKKQIAKEAELHLDTLVDLIDKDIDKSIKYIDEHVVSFIEQNGNVKDYIETLLDDISRFINDELSLQDSGDLGIIVSLIKSYYDMHGVKCAYYDEHIIILREILFKYRDDEMEQLINIGDIIRVISLEAGDEEFYSIGAIGKVLDINSDRYLLVEFVSGDFNDLSFWFVLPSQVEVVTTEKESNELDSIYVYAYGCSRWEYQDKKIDMQKFISLANKLILNHFHIAYDVDVVGIELLGATVEYSKSDWDKINLCLSESFI